MKRLLGCCAQHGCLAWPRAQADDVRLSQARRQARSAAVVGRSPAPPADPVRAGRAARALSGVRGRRGDPRLRQRGGWGWKHARAGSTAHVGGWCRGTATRGKVAAWSRGALSCAMRGVASPALRGGFLLGPAAGRAARQRRAPAGPGKRRGASGCRAVVHGPPGGAASCGEGAPAGVAAVGHREARAPASVSSNPTRVCSRLGIASAHASLRPFPAAETWR